MPRRVTTFEASPATALGVPHRVTLPVYGKVEALGTPAEPLRPLAKFVKQRGRPCKYRPNNALQRTRFARR